MKIKSHSGKKMKIMKKKQIQGNKWKMEKFKWHNEFIWYRVKKHLTMDWFEQI